MKNIRHWTLIIASLLCCMSKAYGEVILTEEDGLLSTISVNSADVKQYEYESEFFRVAEPCRTIQLTFLEGHTTTSYLNDPNGFPFVAFSEFYLYDGKGNEIQLAAENFSTNAQEASEGDIKNICDGDRTTYFHSTWRSGASDYHNLVVTLPQGKSLSEFKFKYITRYIAWAVPKKIELVADEEIVAVGDRIISLSGLQNSDVYCISQPYHRKGITSWAVAKDGVELESNVDLGVVVDKDDSQQQFALICNGSISTIYLYHVAEKKFVCKDGMLSSTPIDKVKFALGAYEHTYVIYFDEEHYINVGGYQEMLVDSWDTADGGNSCVITKVGTFDPSEALATFPPKEVPVSTITLNRTYVTLVEGEKLTLTAEVSPENATDKTITWSTSDSDVAIVNEGVVETLSEGTAVIKAVAGGKIATCQVVVEKKMQSGENFEVDGLAYTIISEEEGTVSVGKGSASPQGLLGIPATVTYKNVTYKVIEIRDYAFSSCDGITAIKLNEGLETIGMRAFEDCISLAEFVLIPRSVTFIGMAAFAGCYNLIALHVESGNTVYDTRDYCQAIIETSTNTLIAGAIRSKIPDTVTTIACYAFLDQKNITSITIPESVKEILFGAFNGCSSLASITVSDELSSVEYGAFEKTAWYDNQPDGLVYVGKCLYAFKGKMPENTSVDIAEGTKSLSAGAFYNCKGLVEVTIPSAVNGMGKAYDITINLVPGVFSECTNLASITCKAANPPVDYGGTFQDVDKNIPVYVPASSVSAYRSAYGWNEFTNIKAIEVSSITLDKTTATLFEGDKLTLTATIVPNETIQECAWSTSNSSVATVNNGVVTAVSPGTATITAKAGDKTAACVVTVDRRVVRVSGIVLSKTTAQLEVDEELTLSATIAPNDATDKSVTWSSSDKKVAIVDSNGRVTAVSAGTATITATANDDSGVKASCEIEVTDSSVMLDGHEFVDLGLPSKKLWATTNYGASSPEKYGTYLAWNDVDRISEAWGSYWKTPSYYDVKELVTECAWAESSMNGVKGYTVTGPNGNSIFLPSAGWSMDGYTDQVGKLVCYWTTTVGDMDGFAFALYANKGTASYNMTYNSELMQVPVRPVSTIASDEIGVVKVASIVLDRSSATLTLGETETLTLNAAVAPADAADKTITWSSNDKKVATVNANGKVTAVSAGTATITATANDGSGVKASCKIEVIDPSIMLDGHEFVDLGLPSKKLWATANYGASSPEKYGTYLDWNDVNRITEVWGESWTTPSYYDAKELVTKCTWVESTMNGVKGYSVTGPNGNSIFLPSAGTSFDGDVDQTGKLVCYWTTTAGDMGGFAYAISASNGSANYYTTYNSNLIQVPVRPVSTVTSDIVIGGVEVSSIQLNISSATLVLGEKDALTLSATVFPDNATDKTVIWSSSNKKVATVDDNGLVIAVNEGSATITAKAGDKSATCVVVVVKPVQVTSLSQLENDAIYYIHQPYHSKGETSWAVDVAGDAMKSNKDLGIETSCIDTRQQFALMSKDNGKTYYLYHVAEGKFVNKNGLSIFAADPIFFMNGAYDNTFVMYFDDTHYVNVGGSREMLIDKWNIADGGNSCSIVKVGTFDFDSVDWLHDYNVYVDLGLSVKWAMMNLGASSSEDFGEYYAWGETVPKSVYSWETYKYCNGSSDVITKYTFDDTTLEAGDDAATVGWGKNWRMPTVEEMNELRSKCSWIYKTLNGVEGYVVKGPNGNEIFLPTAGMMYNAWKSNHNQGRYWTSSTTNKEIYASYLLFDESSYAWYMVDKSYGHSVRAVYQGKVVSPDHAAVNDAIIRNVEVSAQDGIITIKGCAKGDAISIYTINGVIVDQQEADGTSIRIHVATDQMYIVKAAGKVVKILM